MERAQTADWIAARQDHDFDALFIGIEREQLADQAERDTRFRGRFQPRALQRFVRCEIARFEYAVF